MADAGNRGPCDRASRLDGLKTSKTTSEGKRPGCTARPFLFRATDFPLQVHSLHEPPPWSVQLRHKMDPPDDPGRDRSAQIVERRIEPEAPRDFQRQWVEPMAERLDHHSTHDTSPL